MRESIVIAALFVVGTATGASAALNAPYQGSDVLFNVTQTVIADILADPNPGDPWFDPAIGPKTAYVGGGSGNGQAAMAVGGAAVSTAKQQTAPMTKMISNSGNACQFNGDTTGKGVNDGSASGIVLGLDSVDVLSNVQSGAQASAACNGPGGGLAFNGTTAVFGAGTQTWKWVLALVYGGKDLSTGGVTDCNSTARQNLVNNWSKLFQGGACAPSTTVQASGLSASSVCGPGSIPNGRLWHAFRRDDDAGTSDVFASILGLSPSTSNSALNGFGTSPYCNALNWDSNALNANCAYGPHDQWIGPGGVVDPASAVTIATGATGAAGSGNHRRPPPGTWGDKPDPGQTTNSADVLATQMQDNDPIRRTCIGSTTNNHNRAGEEICNLDGALGLVISIVDSSWVLNLPAPNNKQYPTNACTGFAAGKAPSVLTCPIRNTAKHSGECPNGDSLIGGACSVPIDAVNNTSQCVATSANVAVIHSRALGGAYGRIYNASLRDGTVTSPTIGYAQYPVAGTVPASTQDFAGAFHRIHQVETVIGGAAPGCQLVDTTDQIGCLIAEDPCSIGYSGDSAKTWAQRPNGATATSTDPAGTWDVGALQVAAVAPSQTAVQLLGAPGEYQLARKIYFNTLVGFGSVANTTGDPGAADELAIGKFESVAANIDPILTTYGFFPLGPQNATAGANNPFCEDFNEQTICGNGSNANGCTSNPSPIPGALGSTTCGNGVLEPFEECDPGVPPSIPSVRAGAGGCSSICRCNLDYNVGTGACN